MVSSLRSHPLHRDLSSRRVTDLTRCGCCLGGRRPETPSWVLPLSDVREAFSFVHGSGAVRGSAAVATNKEGSASAPHDTEEQTVTVAAPPSVATQ